MEALKRVHMGHRPRHFPGAVVGRSAAASRRSRVRWCAIRDHFSSLDRRRRQVNWTRRTANAVMELVVTHGAGATICMVTHDPRYAGRADRQIPHVRRTHRRRGDVAQAARCRGDEQLSAHRLVPRCASLGGCSGRAVAQCRAGVKVSRARGSAGHSLTVIATRSAPGIGGATAAPCFGGDRCGAVAAAVVIERRSNSCASVTAHVAASGETPVAPPQRAPIRRIERAKAIPSAPDLLSGLPRRGCVGPVRRSAGKSQARDGGASFPRSMGVAVVVGTGFTAKKDYAAGRAVLISGSLLAAAPRRRSRCDRRNRAVGRAVVHDCRHDAAFLHVFRIAMWTCGCP